MLRPGSFDYPVRVNLVGGYRLNSQWEVSTRATFLSGRPFTPYDEAVSTLQRRGVYDLARVNGVRAPDYVRLDFRVDRTFTVGGPPAELFFGVQNVINRRNFAELQLEPALNARSSASSRASSRSWGSTGGSDTSGHAPARRQRRHADYDDGPHWAWASILAALHSGVAAQR